MVRRSFSIGNLVFNVCNYAWFILFTFVCTYPFYYLLIYSLSNPIQAASGIVLAPAGFTFENYRMVFGLNDILTAFFVSASRTAVGTAITIFCCSLFAYVVTKDKLPYRKVIYRFLIITMYLNAGLIPWYLTMKWLGLQDSFLLYVLPSAIQAFNVILIKTYIESLPESLEEAAVMDGAGYLSVYFKIIIPLIKPILATIAVFSAVGQWNSFIDNLLMVSNPKLQTMQMILYNYLNSAQQLVNIIRLDPSWGTKAPQVTPRSVQATITMITTIPIMLVYPFVQRYFVKGLMLGAVKG